MAASVGPGCVWRGQAVDQGCFHRHPAGGRSAAGRQVLQMVRWAGLFKRMLGQLLPRLPLSSFSSYPGLALPFRLQTDPDTDCPGKGIGVFVCVGAAQADVGCALEGRLSWISL